MPVYVYRCRVCGATEDRLRRIGERNDPIAHMCMSSSPDTTSIPGTPVIRDMVRDITEEHSHTDTGYQTPILSEALGISPSQINDAKRRFPHHNFHPDGRMILSSHGERKQVMKDLGFRDWDGFTG